MLVIPRIDDSDFSIVLTCILAAITDIRQPAVRFVDNAIGARFKMNGIEKV